MSQNLGEGKPLMVMDGSRQRWSPGVPYREREAHFTTVDRFLFHGWDPDYFGHLSTPPPEVEAAFQDVYGQYDDTTVKLRLSPVLKRWCIFELCWNKEFGRKAWRVCYICCEKPEHEYYVPTDWRDNVCLNHIAGVVGEYRLPDRADLEEAERLHDCRKYDATELTHRWDQMDNSEAVENDKKFQDYQADFVSYYGRAYVDWANQEEGSAQRTMSVADMTSRLRSDPRFYSVDQHEGFSVRRRRTKEEWEEWVLTVLANARGEEYVRFRDALMEGQEPFDLDRFLEQYEIVEEPEWQSSEPHPVRRP